MIIREHISKFWDTWKNEIIGIPIGIVLFFLAPVMYRWFDPTAGSYDAGVLQLIMFACICVPIFSGAAWIGLRLTFPGLFRWLQIHLQSAFYSLTNWQKIKLCVALYALYLFAFVLAVAAL